MNDHRHKNPLFARFKIDDRVSFCREHGGKTRRFVGIIIETKYKHDRLDPEAFAVVLVDGGLPEYGFEWRCPVLKKNLTKIKKQ